ncbi:single-stranded-DNA-specific exonuclease RecJ [Ornithinibacillus sp. BX22]|uniref:Single-stranded-DNA-specific exonuclease RecJ n=1 Tax=Ornithinibacillus hominis TaxID=2763055 RepID=A0A923L6U8_9BACI|nr:single-stranded-DNA-specific exonuclease RecJ [Ornithinibacillus hominis]MBC5637608.1 single-stranded-DNA-specific exonuclease RecJ [Ornithinibacillus hominis]
MLQSKSKWKFVRTDEYQDQWMDDSIELSPVIKELLVQRGIQSYEEAQEFLMPSIDNLISPMKLASMNIATERVHQAIRANEKILVFGDYDADGVSSTTILIKALEELGANCNFYIPNRFTEGYGPNEAAFREACENGYKLIITVDTGIASVYEAEVAKELGIDLIITDHHEPQEALPDAFAIIHPKCSPQYSFKELAGAGVAFKFAQSLLGYFPEHLLDLVVIGTVADLVPLVGENRILTYYGLRKLSVTKREGLIALKKQCKIEGNTTEEDIGFLIGPRLNAVGRLQDADLAVQLLLTDIPEEAEELAEQVGQLNQERQQIVASIVKEVEQLETIDPEKGVIVVAKQGWNEGVLGIVASRLVRKYDRPAIVLSINEENGTAKGSARSIPAFDLFQSCMKFKEVFTHFGGHAQAAGMTLPIENVRILEKELDHLIQQELTSEDFKQEVLISKTLTLSDISETLIDEIGKLAPFGMANPKPKFRIEAKPNEVRQLGNMKKHLKLLFKENGSSLEGIAFGMGELYHYISPKATLSVVGELGMNEWNGIRKPQLVVEDMRIDHWQLFDHRGKKQVDITNFLNQFDRHMLLYNEDFSNNHDFPEGIMPLTYKEALTYHEEIDVLHLFDLPADLDELRKIVNKVKPCVIHACFYIENSVYLSSFPSREDFKWLYSLIWKRKELNIRKDLQAIINAKGWTKDSIMFMLKVFSELEFVNISNGIIALNSSPQKKDLQEAHIYQERVKQTEIEKMLYYATYEELTRWFEDCMGLMDKPKEEMTHGL